MRTHQHLLHRQSGIVLIVSLFILVLLTIIGVSGMKVTSLEEKMSGNDRDQSVAFQAAEAALRTGEARALAIYNTSDLSPYCDGTLSATTGQQGLFSTPSLNDGGNCSPCPSTPTADCLIPNPLSAATWVNSTTNTQSVPVTTGLSNGATARYYITYHYFYRTPGSALPKFNTYYFVVTSRGAGAKGGEVILRSYFGAKVPVSL